MSNKPDRLTTDELDAYIEMDRSVLDDVQIETDESEEVDADE